MGKSKRIDWSKVEDLGKVPDSVIAKRLGIPASKVWVARYKRGISGCGRASKCSIDWDSLPYGKMTDRALAKAYRVSIVRISAERQRRNIYPCGRIDWSKVLDVGIVPDSVIATRLKCNVSSVRAIRESRGLPIVRVVGEVTPELIPILAEELKHTWSNAVALKYGISPSNTALLRRRLGIKTYSEQRTCFCGNTFKAIRSNHIACSRKCRIRIASAERSLGLPTGTDIHPKLLRMYAQTTEFYNTLGYGPKGIDWDSIEDLGKTPDLQIARRLGCDKSSVWFARKRRGI